MFRMEFQEVGRSLTVRLEGRFIGNFAEETLSLISRRKTPEAITVDITEMTFADLNGEQALTWLSQMGASFIAERSYALDVCERLSLPVVKGSGIGDRRQIAAD